MWFSVWFGTLLLLTGACTRKASTAPLGGEEWIRPERHVDRRARDAAPSERVSLPTKSAPASAPSKLPAATVATTETKAEPGEGRFGFVPFARGDTITIETHFRIRAVLSTSFQGLSTNEDADVVARERIEVKVVEASADGVRELEVFYAESKSVARFGDEPEDEESNAGERYRVMFAGGKPEVRRDSGALDPDREKGVIFDLGTVTGYVPLVRDKLPATLASGFSARIEASELARVFGSLQTVQFDAASLRLRGRDPKRQEVSVFECTLPVRIDRDGATFAVNLSGSCNVRTADSRPLEISLSGPLRAAAGAAFTSASSLTGTFEAEIKHSYGKNTR